LAHAHELSCRRAYAHARTHSRMYARIDAHAHTRNQPRSTQAAHTQYVRRTRARAQPLCACANVFVRTSSQVRSRCARSVSKGRQCRAVWLQH
jgi:hypothetical protein